MFQSNPRLPPKHQTFFSFDYDIETQTYDSRFYTPILTKGRIRQQQIQNFLNQFNNQLPITRGSFWEVICPAIICSMLLTAPLGHFLVFIFDYFNLVLLFTIYSILAMVLIIVFGKLYVYRKASKMQKALEYYNRKVRGLGIKWCCDRVNEFGFLVIDLRRENEGNILLIQENSDSDLSDENKSFDLILDVLLDGRVLNAQARAQDGSGSHYTPDLTDGRLSIKEFNEVVELVYNINVGIFRKLTMLNLGNFLLFVATVIIIASIPDYSCFTCWYPAISIILLGILVGFASLSYETAKRREKKKLVQDIIDCYNPNIESLGLRWVYPQSGIGIQIYKEYLLSGLADDEDLEIGSVGENDPEDFELANINNMVPQNRSISFCLWPLLLLLFLLNLRW